MRDRRRRWRAYGDLVLGSPGLVGYWRLGERSGTVASDEMGANHGTYVAAPTLAAVGLLAGDADTAVTLNGSTQRVTVLAVPANLKPATVTFAAWVSPSVVDDTLNFVGGLGTTGVVGWYLHMHNTAGFRFTVGNGSATANTASSGVPVVGTTYFVAGTFDGATIRCYINAALVGSGTALAGPIGYTGVNDLHIGSLQGNTGMAARYFPGTIDEVAIWPRALTAAEISHLYRVGRGY